MLLPISPCWQGMVGAVLSERFQLRKWLAELDTGDASYCSTGIISIRVIIAIVRRPAV